MLGGLSPWHIIVLIIVVALVFGRKGKISSIMEDIGGGFRALRKGLSDVEDSAKEAERELRK